MRWTWETTRLMGPALQQQQQQQLSTVAVAAAAAGPPGPCTQCRLSQQRRRPRSRRSCWRARLRRCLRRLPPCLCPLRLPWLSSPGPAPSAPSATLPSWARRRRCRRRRSCRAVRTRVARRCRHSTAGTAGTRRSRTSSPTGTTPPLCSCSSSHRRSSSTQQEGAHAGARLARASRAHSLWM